MLFGEIALNNNHDYFDFSLEMANMLEYLTLVNI